MQHPDSRARSIRPRSRWSQHEAVRLHWLDSAAPSEFTEAAECHEPAGPGEGRGGRPDALPLVFVPGFGEEALDHLGLFERLAPRRVIVPDLRGRGPSDAPLEGYALADHVGDLEAVMRDARVDRIHVASYSRGTAYAVKWAIDHAGRVASLTIGDYPAEHIAPPAGAVEALADRTRFERPILERVSYDVMQAVFAACVSESYYAGLAALREVPLLLVHGARRSSMVDGKALARYREARPDIEIEVFEDSGHDLWRPDPDRFAETVARFVNAAD